MRSFFLFVLAILFSFSCKKEKDPLLIFLSPTRNIYTVSPEDVIRIDITGSSGYSLNKLKISQRKINSTSIIILDSALSTNNLAFTFEYKVPAGNDSTTYYLEISIFDDSGNKISTGLTVYSYPTDMLLIETAGHEMYSHASSGFDAYNLVTGSPLHSESSDSIYMNIMDLTSDTVNQNVLLRKWGSPAGNKFVRFNDFDYANTTFTSLRNSYNAGIKNTFMENISNGDIILTKLGNPIIDTGYIAIKVVLIIDEDSTQLDRYIFNLKRQQR